MEKKKLDLSGLEKEFNELHGISHSEYVENLNLTSTTQSSTSTTTTTYLPGASWSEYDPESGTWITGTTQDTVTVTGTIRSQGVMPGASFNPVNDFGGTINSVVSGSMYLPNFQDYIRTNLSQSNSILGAVTAYGEYNQTANYNSMTTIVSGYDVFGNNIGSGVKVGNPFIGGGAFMNYNTNTQTTEMGISANVAFFGMGFALSTQGVTTNFNFTVPWNQAQTYGVDLTLKWPAIAAAAAILMSGGALIPAF